MDEQKLSAKQILTILSAGLFSFCGVLIETATNITFPTLMEEFAVSTSTVQWMTTGNLLMMGIFIPISSFLKKRFQSKHLFLTAGILFSSGLVIDMIAPTFPILLIGRLIQGVGVGIALPMMYNIILEESPKRLLGLMMGIGSFVTASAPAIGPTYGGIMTEYLSWRYIFATVLPIIVIATLTGFICMGKREINNQERLDVLGFISIGVAFTTLIMGFSNLDKISSQTILVIGYFVVGIFALGYFGYHQIHTKAPLIHFDIFHSRSFTFHTLAIMCIQMVTLGYGLLIPTYVQVVLKQSATDAGVILLPGAVIGAVMAPIGGMILDKLGAKKPIMFGVILSVLSTIAYVVLFNSLTYTSCLIIYFLYSLGMGLIVGNTMTSALSHLSATLQPDGNATIQTLQQLSGGIGTSVSAAILAIGQAGVDLYTGTQNGSLYVFIYLVVMAVLVAVCQMIAFKGDK